MLLNFITCLVIFLKAKRYIVTPTPTCFTIFVKLILIASIKPNYNTLNNSKWLFQLTVSGAKKNQYNAESFERIRFHPTYFYDVTAHTHTHTHTHIHIYITHTHTHTYTYIYITHTHTHTHTWIVMEFLVRLTCRTNSSNSPF